MLIRQIQIIVRIHFVFVKVLGLFMSVFLTFLYDEAAIVFHDQDVAADDHLQDVFYPIHLK